MSNKDIEEKQCCKCNSDYEDSYYKYNEKIYCFDCLIEELESDVRLQVVSTTHYYNEDWGELGTSDEIDEVVQNICEKYEVEEIDG